MAATRNIVLNMQVCVSKKSDNTCAHDRKNHPVPRGESWLRITDTGAMKNTTGYLRSLRQEDPPPSKDEDRGHTRRA